MKKLHTFLPLLLSFAIPLSAETTITLDSDEGDYVGQGQSYLYTDENAKFQYSTNYDNGITVRINNLPDDPYFRWSIDLAAPQNAEIQPGTYEYATRFPFQDADVPGLVVSGNGRGCNTLTGSFEVHQVSYDEVGTLLSLTADFVQHCEGKEPALRGSIAYNPPQPLGADTSGLDVTRIVCSNRTSGQRIVVKTNNKAFDCKVEGLQVNPGDKIDMRILGTAQ